METGLVQFDKAMAALAEAHSIDEVKQIRDQAEAMRQYIKQQKGSLVMQNQAAEIKIRAERRAGEMLGERDKNKGARGIGVSFHDESAPTLSELGISENQSHRWQLEAGVPEVEFEEHVGRVLERNDELTTISIIRVAKRIKREQALEENETLIKSAPPLPNNKYKTILIDPPWDWGDEGDFNQFGRARPTFGTIPFNELIDLPMSELSEPNSHIYVWITNRSLPKGFKLLECWGFRYITLLTWCKPSFGLGNYFRGQTEHVMFGVKGSCPLLRHDVGTWFTANRENGHSSKPTKMFEIIETCSPGPYLQMFGRKNRDGWTSWGAEI